MSTIQVTQPHFVRCIKPNPKNRPDDYDRNSVVEQLRWVFVVGWFIYFVSGD
jgi:myosin heavy subunit